VRRMRSSTDYAELKIRLVPAKVLSMRRVARKRDAGAYWLVSSHRNALRRILAVYALPPSSICRPLYQRGEGDDHR
jgi:hypothetical protein